MSENLAWRALRTESVLDRFRERPFSWVDAHCILLAHAQATAMGHDLPPVPRFRTLRGARRALRAQGVASTEELLDRWLVRRAAPAFAQIGDLVLLPSECDGAHAREELGAIGVADGQGNIFAWHAVDLTRMSTIKFAAAHVRVAWAL